MAKKKAPKKGGYVGPHYDLGIVIGSTTYDPKKMTAKQKADFLKRYPSKAAWWGEKKKPEST